MVFEFFAQFVVCLVGAVGVTVGFPGTATVGPRSALWIDCRSVGAEWVGRGAKRDICGGRVSR